MKPFVYLLASGVLFVSTLAARADAVNATALPLGAVEVVGSAGDGAHVLRLDAEGKLVAWGDSHGNTFLNHYVYYEPLYGVEVVDEKGATVYPVKGSHVQLQTVSPTEIDAVVSAPPEPADPKAGNGFTLTYIITPARLGLRVSTAATLRLRYQARAESCRVQASAPAAFGGGNLGDASQLVIDAKRTRAMRVTPPAGVAVRWQLRKINDRYAAEHLYGESALLPGQTLWLSSEPEPAYAGPVDVGFFPGRMMFQHTGDPIAVARLSSAQLAPERSVTLSFPRPVDSIVKTGVVVAALIPTAPEDPVETSEGMEWHMHGDPAGPVMLPLKLEQGRDTLRITAPAATPSGVYRMRFWIVPHGTPLPETLGGKSGVIVPYFPGSSLAGFFGNYPYVQQPTPNADIFVSVHRASGGSLAVTIPDQRNSFWRGEDVHLLVHARAPGDTTDLSTTLTVTHEPTGRVVASRVVGFSLTDGQGAAEFALPTTNLAPGRYRVTPSVNDSLEPYECSFTVAGPRTPGMALIASPMYHPSAVETYQRYGLNVWTDIMAELWNGLPQWSDPGAIARGLAATDPALPAAISPTKTSFDDLVQGNWLMLQGLQARQISFFLYHSIPEHVEETYRKHLVYAQAGQRFPSTLGLVFDYDLVGVMGSNSWGAGWEDFGRAGQKRTALLTARWEKYWKEAQARGATAADEARTHILFNSGVIEEMYSHSIAELHDVVPEQRHTSSITADHTTFLNGQYLPADYRPLDFRYIEAWNDQNYINSAHDMQEVFWGAILRVGKPANEPLWVTVPTAPQPGTHLRRALNAIARGVTGFGYGSEGAAGLTGDWGPDVARAATWREAEVRLSGDAATRYGAWLNAFAPAEGVALLYSDSQEQNSYALMSPVFYAYYALARLNRPARLMSEEEIVSGELSKVKALVIVRQVNSPTPAAVAAIEQFAAAGGKVICDNGTTVAIKGMTKLPGLYFAPNLWPAGGNEFHEMIEAMAGKATERELRVVRRGNPKSIPPGQGDTLLAALGDAGRQPLEPIAGEAIVSSKVAGDQTLVFVTNENIYPFDELFTDAQLKTMFFRIFDERGATFYKDVRVPRRVTLRLRDDLAAKPPHIYDAFAGRELAWDTHGDGPPTVTIDLATLQGRVLMLTPKAVESPTVMIARRRDADPLATVVVRSDAPLPVRVRVGDQVVYRAATAEGSCDTFAIGPKEQSVGVEVTELITGKVRRGTLRITNQPTTPLNSLPGVQVRDEARVGKALAAKNLAIYVDPRQADQLDAAKQLAVKIPGSEVVFNPRVEDYPVGWDLPPEQESANERIRTQGLLAQRRVTWGYLQWAGALSPTMVWNRPVVVFGDAGSNRLIADMNSVTLLPRPATPGAEAIGPGRAYIGVAPSAFWHGQDVVYALASDEAGTRAALDKIAVIAQRHGQTAAPDDAESPLAERRRQLGFEPLKYPSDLVKLKSESAGSLQAGLDPCIAVAALQPTTGGLVVALGTPGKNLVGLDNHGRERWRAMSAGFYQPGIALANAAGESVVGDDAFTWRHGADGRVLWKTLGSPVTPPLRDGSAWVLSEANTLDRIAADGSVPQSLPLHDKLLGATADGRLAFVQRAGKEPSRARVGASLVAVDLTDGKDRWSLPQSDITDMKLGDEDKILACVEREDFQQRDDYNSPIHRVAVVDVATGKLLARVSMGRGVDRPLVSGDGRTVSVRGADLDDMLYLIDVASGAIRRVCLPEAGGWAQAFSADGKSLWVACDNLYRVDLETLHVDAASGRKIVQLTATPAFLVAGTTDGRVLWLNNDGRVERETALATGIGLEDTAKEMHVLRDAPLVRSASLRPNEVPGTITLGHEYPAGGGETLNLRGDGIAPVYVAIRVPEPGRYRFTVNLVNPPTDGDKIGFLHLFADDGATTNTQPVNGDKWHQAGVLQLQAGVWQVCVQPQGWKGDAVLGEMKVEKAEQP